jgi:hypothetical protein
MVYKLLQTLIIMDFLKYWDGMKELEDKEPNAERSSRVSKDTEAYLHYYKKALNAEMMAGMH